MILTFTGCISDKGKAFVEQLEPKEADYKIHLFHAGRESPQPDMDALNRFIHSDPIIAGTFYEFSGYDYTEENAKRLKSIGIEHFPVYVVVGEEGIVFQTQYLTRLQAFMLQELGMDPDRYPAFNEAEPAIDPAPDVERTTKYSYLDHLSIEYQAKFADYVADRNLDHLAEFAPEDMVAVFLHILSIGDPDLLYPITYDGGKLPEHEVFRDQYLRHFTMDSSDMAVHYRYYDAVEIDRETSSEEEVIANVKVNVGLTHHSLALQLMKEERIWKINIYHAIDPEWGASER